MNPPARRSLNPLSLEISAPISHRHRFAFLSMDAMLHPSEFFVHPHSREDMFKFNYRLDENTLHTFPLVKERRHKEGFEKKTAGGPMFLTKVNERQLSPLYLCIIPNRLLNQIQRFKPRKCRFITNCCPWNGNSLILPA